MSVLPKLTWNSFYVSIYGGMPRRQHAQLCSGGETAVAVLGLVKCLIRIGNHEQDPSYLCNPQDQQYP